MPPGGPGHGPSGSSRRCPGSVSVVHADGRIDGRTRGREFAAVSRVMQAKSAPQPLKPSSTASPIGYAGPSGVASSLFVARSTHCCDAAAVRWWDGDAAHKGLYHVHLTREFEQEILSDAPDPGATVGHDEL